MECLAMKLLSRGDMVCIERGQLAIQPASGKPVPPQWIAEHAPDICRAILTAADLDAFEYVGYTTGHYGKHKASGVTLQFVSVITGENVYAIFNADLTRQRTTAGGKAGAPLPKGQFRVGKRSHFYKFWLSTGIPVRRLSDFHDYMGHLSGILCAGNIVGDRIDVGTLRPVSLSEAEIAVLPDTIPTPSRQARPTKKPSNASNGTAYRRIQLRVI